MAEKNELYKSTMQKMLCIGRLHRGVFEKNISSRGIHHSQYRLLMYIANEGSVSSQKQISEKFGVTPAAIARALKNLEQEGYVKRKSTVSDSRFNQISITQKGKDIVEMLKLTFIETDETAFEDFTGEDIEKFNVYLDMMISKLMEKYDETSERRKNEEQND